MSQLSVVVVQIRPHESWIAWGEGGGGGFFGSSLIWDMEVGRSDRCFLGSSSGPNLLVWAPERLANETPGEAREVCCVSSE